MRSSACVAAVLAGVMAGGVQAAESAKPASAPKTPASKAEPVDAEFLEFLGSVDTEEEEWRQYLEDRPIKAAGKPAQPKASLPTQPDPKSQQVKKP
ncbi:MAG: hypothetical protein WDO12_10530 [Pseudomonadota bacterium]